MTAEMIAAGKDAARAVWGTVPGQDQLTVVYRAMAAVDPNHAGPGFSAISTKFLESLIDDRRQAWAERDAAIALADMYQRWFYNATESPEAADAVSPVGKARDTIQNLRAGIIPRQLVRDLGDAVERAKQDLAVGGMKG